MATTSEQTARWLAEQNARQPIREAYFKLVAPAADWKAPIDALVPAGVSLDALRDAVEHFTATTPTICSAPAHFGVPMFRVQSIGYRAGPAGP